MKTIFSGIQPTGALHLGNYIGALKQWVELQNENDALFCIVDLHAITVAQDPKTLHEKILQTAAMYLACGVNPEKAHIFIQSENPNHTYLAWILDCVTSMGQLRRMTQFKDKVQKKIKELDKLNENYYVNGEKKSLNLQDTKSQEVLMSETLENVSSVGLFNYPVLMAADILLYDTDEVPVGEDQKQHIELTRDIAEKFNRQFGEIFKLPTPKIQKETARVMSLQNPNAKMSKSDTDPNGAIFLLDSEEVIREKIKRAVTDSGSEIRKEEGRGAISNLLTIYEAVSGKTARELEEQYKGSSYSTFKEELASSVVEFMKPIQKNYQKYIDGADSLSKILDDGRDFAIERSAPILEKAKNAVGLGR